jgi:hypothetical protein
LDTPVTGKTGKGSPEYFELPPPLTVML